MKINVSDSETLAAVFGKFVPGKFKYDYTDVPRLAQIAEARIELLPKAHRAGAKCVVLSGGGKLPNSYRYKRTVTRMVLERGRDAWFVVELAETELWPNQAGGARITLTAAQLEKLREAHEADLLNF